MSRLPCSAQLAQRLSTPVSMRLKRRMQYEAAGTTYLEDIEQVVAAGADGEAGLLLLQGHEAHHHAEQQQALQHREPRATRLVVKPGRLLWGCSFVVHPLRILCTQGQSAPLETRSYESAGSAPEGQALSAAHTSISARLCCWHC